MKTLFGLFGLVVLLAGMGCVYDDDHHHHGGYYGGSYGEYPHRYYGHSYYYDGGYSHPYYHRYYSDR